ncbi:MAG TPA: outer membrane lipid asymmetry maintenance protein MlaD [Burkholderiales bacterium]|nr:outer membrane lipid asymmetry maintenance protein MlaD [Burkholderiales bacterium]
MNRTLLDAWVGIFVVVGIGALFVLALKIGNASTSLNMGDTYQVFAEFENIGGLKPRAPAKSAGVLVGRVDSIQFDSKKFVARVTLTIDKRYVFPKDSSVSILTAGLLGEQYVGIEAGGDSASLKDGDTVMLTQSAVVLEKLIGQFLYSKAAEGAPQKSDK